jgi:glutaconate CoA-transferase, subunit B
MQQISDEAYEVYLKERGLARDQYTTMELLAVASAREVPDGAFVFAGTGLPLLASMLAQFTVAPNMTLIMEAGIVGPKVEHLPISVSDRHVGRR